MLDTVHFWIILLDYLCLQFHCRFQAPVEREVSGSGPQLLECFPCTSNQQLINRTCIDITEGLLVKYNTNVLVKNNVHKCVKTRNTVKATVCKHNNASILPYMYSSKMVYFYTNDKAVNSVFFVLVYRHYKNT